MLKVLLVEDEALFAKSVVRRLQREGHECEIENTLVMGRERLKRQPPDVILLDVRLPDGNGLDLLTDLQTEPEGQRIPVIVMTAYGELRDAVTAMKKGATDYLKKPVDLDELVLTLNKVVEKQKLSEQLDYSTVRESLGAGPVNMIGFSRPMQQVKQQLERIVTLVDKSREAYPIMLISGETGVGKDVAARYYHQIGSWRNRPYVHVDCAALPAELIEAELFGYERGAFTNAHQAKPGLIEVAEDGTLFLDEIGEMPLELQAKLLNVLERRKIRRIGATRERDMMAHVVAATNRDLQQMVDAGTFRSDLYFRLNVLDIQLPPLRERQEDIAPLAFHFIEMISKRYGIERPGFTPRAVESLQHYAWPGNIRELQHVMERAVMLCQDDTIDEQHLMLEQQQSKRKPASSQGLSALNDMTFEEVEKYLLERALERTAGNVSGAARALGLSRMAMRYRMEKYQL